MAERGRPSRPGLADEFLWAAFRSVMNVHKVGQPRASRIIAARGGLGKARRSISPGKWKVFERRAASSLARNFRMAEARYQSGNDPEFVSRCDTWLAVYEEAERRGISIPEVMGLTKRETPHDTGSWESAAYELMSRRPRLRNQNPDVFWRRVAEKVRESERRRLYSEGKADEARSLEQPDAMAVRDALERRL